MSPRRYGKSSLVRKAVDMTGRPCVYFNMRQVTNMEDFSAMVDKVVYKAVLRGEGGAFTIILLH